MSKPAKNNPETINQKIEELKSQIDWFSSEDFSLNEAEARYESALKLAKSLELDLTSLKNRITVLSKDFSS